MFELLAPSGTFKKRHKSNIQIFITTYMEGLNVFGQHQSYQLNLKYASCSP